MDVIGYEDFLQKLNLIKSSMSSTLYALYLEITKEQEEIRNEKETS